MITRLRVHHYRSLVNFETEFDSFGVLCGPNGAGKSSVFDAINLLRSLTFGEVPVEQAITFADQTKWLDWPFVDFEVDIAADGHKFSYKITIEQPSEIDKPRISAEIATCDGYKLFTRDHEGVSFKGTHPNSGGFPLDGRVSALGATNSNLRELQQLQKALRRVLVLRPNPLDMEAESKVERPLPRSDMYDLTSWFRSLSSNQEFLDHLRKSLQDVWPDFYAFNLVSTGGQSKALQLRFDKAESGSFTVSQLSAGERMLLGLYMIKSVLAISAIDINTVLIDEPDNFVGLPELQPWILSLMETLGDDTQAILISHHPEILSIAGERYGRYLWRDTHMEPTRIAPLRTPEGISTGESIARGWVNV